MSPEAWGVLKARMETMDGFPAWSQQMSDDYREDLRDIAEGVSQDMARNVRRRFDKRPSVRALLDWAVELTPARTFDLLTDCNVSRPDAVRLTGPAVARVGSAIPPHVKARFEAIRNKHVEPDDLQQFGLQFRTVATGQTTRTAASYNRPAAEARAAERNRKWPHVVTTVFHRDDPPEPRTQVNPQEDQRTPELTH